MKEYKKIKEQTFTQESLKMLYLSLSYTLASDSEKVLMIGLEGYLTLSQQSFESIEVLTKSVLYSVHRASLVKDTIFHEKYSLFISILITLKL